MSARGTAHGKVILFGEHAVVHGVPALAVGIGRGAWAEAVPRTRESAPGDAPPSVPPSTLFVRGWKVTVSDDATEDSLPLARSLRDVLIVTRRAQEAAGVAPVGPVTIEAEADLPPEAGSAAPPRSASRSRARSIPAPRPR